MKIWALAIWRTVVLMLAILGAAHAASTILF